MSIRYAENLLDEQRDAFMRVQVAKDYTKLTGYSAKAGALGYVVAMDRGMASVMFDRASADKVNSNHVGQCMLDIPWLYLKAPDKD